MREPVPVRRSVDISTGVKGGFRDQATSAGKTRICCVLDLETVPDRFAMTLARKKRPALTSPLNEVQVASMMRLTFGADDALSSAELRTLHRDDHEESDLVGMVLDEISQSLASGGQLVTFNGRRHDAHVLRLRQLRWWLGHGDLIAKICEEDAAHFDVMAELTVGGARFPSLSEACAMLGFALRGPDKLFERDGLPADWCKCEIDVVGTAILYLHLRADRTADTSLLGHNLAQLGESLRGLGGTSPHLARFASSPLLGSNARPWGSN